MANVLFAWELGGGLSHVAEMLPLVKGLRAAGHRVQVALRDFARAAGLFAETGAECLPAPEVPASARRAAGPAGSFTYVLAEAGFADRAALCYLTDAWSKLIDSFAPDLIVFDHSPVALLAAWGRAVKRVLLGNGFCCPPDCSPWPDLRSRRVQDSGQLRLAEEAVLDCANGVLQSHGWLGLTHLAQLYGAVDDVFLSTFAEFDPYSALTTRASSRGRGERRYRGPWALSGGAPPSWPGGSGKRVYAYLGPSPVLPRLLELLVKTDYRLIISAGQHAPSFLRQYARPNVRFETRPLDLLRVAAECDAAVLNGNHSTTLLMLLAGKPVLQIPLFVEQGLNARATVELGAGLSTFPRGVEHARGQLADLLGTPKYSHAAGQFGAKYSSFSFVAETRDATCRLEELVVGPV